MPTYAQDTIIALSTPSGEGAIGVIRLSGSEAITLVNQIFHGKNLLDQPSHTLHFGTIRQQEEILDEVVVSLFIAPHSFTKENVVEISCHGSSYIIQQIIELFISLGARLAKPGEFTQRAYLNGQYDLAQAEAIAELIAADSQVAHRAAMYQMRGGFSREIHQLREQLVRFASLIELELDFSEEDVEFANREELKKLVQKILAKTQHLIQSFSIGNVIKNGVPTVIAGKPNVGKSTLLNALLNEEKAIVSDIPGTTRDVIEDEITLEGIRFRFIDTAGIRETTDTIEAIGVQRTYEKMQQAALILYLFDLEQGNLNEITEEIASLEKLNIPLIKVGNKLDKAQKHLVDALRDTNDVVFISALTKHQLAQLQQQLISTLQLNQIQDQSAIVTNLRHYESLKSAYNNLQQVISGIDQGITHDFLAQDIRYSLHALGEITGDITNDELLGTIFSKFCIGK
ncbi:tRNA uridine-5-carboxymethylaminomethyl(34) synthesis GTPase MnmE [Tunicatimonas pelagia]|uniref:tRNA uridine-5-carboxymethylaminomethyl(34) synthesis GTPase MnmE n=1 Tax=Tunicatimonas pelagia TaxID=931531 RepID=UPI002666E890|nr:tRNA uridine-5-carboxymethylaminomethyl(34) synthesis GTPase MnmE [Tunicatimonas pelagia]WKN43620.1 tRNA uridine-5-carboxymethylaminomethyl(34) synthesis GTPase MnmE [Tunicatimonas pelagia]